MNGVVGESRIPATDDAFRAPSGPAAIGTPDFFDVDAEGRERASDWASGLTEPERRFVLEADSDLPWVSVDGSGTLLPPSVARNPSALRRRRLAIGDERFFGASGGRSSALLWILVAGGVLLVATS